MEDLFRVPDMDTGEYRDLELFEVQKKVVHAYFYGNAGKIALYKGRRIGYSFIVELCYLVEGIVKPNSFYPIVSRTKTQAKNRISDIKKLIDHSRVEIPTQHKNKGDIRLWNNSGFMAFSGDPDTSRGDESARAVLQDEAAFIEDQEKTDRAFGAFIALGKNRTMVKVSTPNTRNDKFMQDFRSGTPTGVDENGNPTTLSIKQPSFYNADEIDVNRSLLEQEVKPVRPDMNILQIEEERATDPEGFGQEYLCRPVIDEYRFFSEDSVEAALQKSRGEHYDVGLHTPAFTGHIVLGIDIGIDSDNTVISVCEHKGDSRYQRYIEIVTNRQLENCGIADPDRGNANHIAERIHQIYSAVGADLVVMDRTGAGETFQRITERRLGRSIMGFNFSDKEGVSDMMGDMNSALRNGRAVLVSENQSENPDETRIFDEFASIVKEKRDDYARPKFSGKENSESGKDDMVFATCLSAFPPKFNSQTTTPTQREKEIEHPVEMASPTAKVDVSVEKQEEKRQQALFGARNVSRASQPRKQRYQRRSVRRTN